jgi:hypothetical protein
MPVTSVLWPRNGISVGLPFPPPKMVSPQCARFSPQDARERHSSRWPAYPQASKCLCSSHHLGHARTAPLVAANQACAYAQLPVLAGATWPCAWLLPCTGLAFPESSTIWSGNFRRVRCAASCHSGSTPSLGLSRIRGCQVTKGQRGK